mmetsp:Transcript_8083/g.17517  ORF Transcript_8083/g.17517 Transcript_8083/m.17517 type:complete len:234 (-) Transcript_8083:462-1163(-)
MVPLHSPVVKSHIFTIESRPPDITRPAVQTKSSTGPLCPPILHNSLLLTRSQTRRVRSYEQDTARGGPTALHRTLLIDPLCPVRSEHTTPEAFQRQSLVSMPADKILPSAQCETEVTHSPWPYRFECSERFFVPLVAAISAMPWSALPKATLSLKILMHRMLRSETSTARPPLTTLSVSTPCFTERKRVSLSVFLGPVFHLPETVDTRPVTSRHSPDASTGMEALRDGADGPA